MNSIMQIFNFRRKSSSTFHNDESDSENDEILLLCRSRTESDHELKMTQAWEGDEGLATDFCVRIQGWATFNQA